MAKRLKFRISRFISSLQCQWQSCRSKNPNTLPFNPVPSTTTFFPPHHHRHHHHHPITDDGIHGRALETNPTITPIKKISPPKSLPPRKPDPYSLKRNVSTAFFSVSCDLRPRPTITDGSCSGLQWQKEDKWHVLKAPNIYKHRQKIYSSSGTAGSSDADHDVRPYVSERRKKKKRQAKNKKTTTRARGSTSSADSCGLFSSQGTQYWRDFPEETESLVASTEFSTSDQESKTMKRKESKKLSRQRRSVSSEMSSGSPARLSVFQRFIPCKVEGKVRESLAVVKRSKDPYEDFRRSMMEMILENNMFEEGDLEQLLQCFLSLNSSQHHGVIIQAYCEVRNALVCRRS